MKLTERKPVEAAEAELGDVLKNFRGSVHAWSEAELARPRAVFAADPRRTWRRAAAWALGCVLAAGSLAAGIYEYYGPDSSQSAVASNEVQQPAAAASQQAAPDTAVSTAQPAAAPVHSADEGLMAIVDRDVSRDVPSAMEPLAQLMDEGSSSQ